MSRPETSRALHSIFVFAHRHAAEEAAQELIRSGIREDCIGLFVHAGIEKELKDSDVDTAADQGGGAGLGLGAVAGAVLFAVPGLGPVLGVGPLAAAFAGAITGGTLGGFAGSLAGLGLSKAHAALAERHIREGKAMLLVRNAADQEVVLRIVQRHHGKHVTAT